VPEGSGLVIEQTSTRVVYETWHMRLREDGIRRPDGSAGTYSYVEKPDFALIIPVENGGFHLVEQYRYPVRMRCWEFPQGTLPGMAVADDPEHLAREELRQETGLTASVLRHLGHLHWFGRAEVEAMIRHGGITDDCTLAAYTLFLLAGETAG